MTHTTDERKTKTFDVYMNFIKKIKYLDKKEERKLISRYRKNKDKKAFDKLVIGLMPMVVGMAKRYVLNKHSILDLIQTGNVALCNAVKNYDPKNIDEACLHTYAKRAVYNSFQQYTFDNWHQIKMPYGTDLEKRLRAVSKEIQNNGGDQLNDHQITELAQRLGISKKETEFYQNYVCLDRVSIGDFTPSMENEKINAFNDAIMEENYEKLSVSDEVETDLQNNDFKKILNNAMDQVLTKRQKLIVQKRMLLDEPMTLVDTGDMLGVSRQTIANEERKAMDLLKKYFSNVHVDM